MANCSDVISNVTDQFERVMKDAEAATRFRRFLESHYAEENFDFYVACLSFEKLQDPKQIEKEAKKIYNTWIDRSALSLINISGTTFKEVESNKNNPHPKMFSSCKDHVIRLMAPMVFPFEQEEEKGITRKNSNGSSTTKPKVETPPMTLKKSKKTLALSRKKLVTLDEEDGIIMHSDTKKNHKSVSPRQIPSPKQKKSDNLMRSKSLSKLPKRSSIVVEVLKMEDVFTSSKVYRDYDKYLKQQYAADYLHFCDEVMYLKKTEWEKDELNTFIAIIASKYLGLPNASPLCTFDPNTAEEFIEKFNQKEFSKNIFDELYDDVWDKLTTHWVNYLLQKKKSKR